jgi:hypothetical protein
MLQGIIQSQLSAGAPSSTKTAVLHNAQLQLSSLQAMSGWYRQRVWASACEQVVPCLQRLVSSVGTASTEQLKQALWDSVALPLRGVIFLDLWLYRFFVPNLWCSLCVWTACASSCRSDITRCPQRGSTVQHE